MKTFWVLSLTLLVGSLGHIFLAKGMKMMGPMEGHSTLYLLHYFSAAVANPWVSLGILLELAYFLLWLAVLSLVDVSFAAPMNALQYIIVALLAFLWLGETIQPARWIGILFLTLGAGFMVKSFSRRAYD